MSTSSLHSHKDEELNDSNKLDMMNDVELDEVMEKNETSTSHDDISTDYDLLRVDAGGLRGLIERIPLTIKLVIMCAVTLLGMMTIGAFMVAIQAKSLKTVRSSYLFQSIANNVGDYIAAMQTEREASLAFLANNATKSNPALKEAYLNAVDNSLAHFKTMNTKAIRGQGITTTDRNFGTILASMQSIEATLPTYRSFVIDTTIDTASIMRYYNGYLAVIVDFLTRFAYVGGAQPSAMSYVTMTRLVEVNELLRSLGRISFATGVLTDIRYRGFYVYVTQRKYVYSLWTNTAKASSIDYYNSVVSAESTTTIEMLENKLLDQINCVNCPIANITPAFTGYWSANMSARLEAHREVQKSLSVDMIDEASRTLRVSVATLVVLVVLIVFFFIISTATSYIAATTIIGPWARLNAIQEQAISKFVPKGFLRLLHCSRITDLSLGKVVQQPLTIMKLDIRDFAKFTKTFKKEEIFEYLNTYLDHVGPIIRKHKGFIDKHQGDGFTALFDSASQGLKASIEIQSASKAFNVQVEDKYPAINIGVGVHTGDMLVGTVGEDERWFHSVISQHASVADILERLSSKMSTGLLTTNSVIEKCSKSVSKHVELRVIGRINIEEIVQSSDNTPDASQIHVYEVLKPEVDSAKIATKVDFEEAVNLFYQHRYEEAVKRFDSIISQSPNDLLAIAYKQRATALNNQVRFTASNITLADTLASPALFHGMKEFCKSEYSSENIELWEMIEQYKKVDTGSERRNMAELISRDFLSLDGRAAVNINQQLKDNILQELSSTHDAAPNLFYSLQKELELVMGDTLKRYKATTFVLATLSQTYAPPRLDEL